MNRYVFIVLFDLILMLFLGSCKKGKLVPNDDSFNNDTIPEYEYNWNLAWPSWIFSPWVWEDESTMQSAKQLINDYKAHDIPVGAIIIDSPWETGYNTFDWDSNLYQDPMAMIDFFHSNNVKVIVWITGVINTGVNPLYDYGVNHGYFMKQSANSSPAVVHWWKGDGSLVDFYNPEAVDWWKGLMDKTLALGIDGWKCDGTDFYELTASYSPYAQNTIPRIDYSHTYYRLFFDYTRSVLGNDRIITARPVDNYGLGDIGGEQVSFAPVDINWAGWVGDQDASFDGLTKALNNMYHSYEMGYLAFGSDIGGYRENNNYPQGRSKELFLRWAGLGAFSPIMENGGGGEHRPWMFDEETTDIYRRFARIHQNLVPYLMSHSDEYFNNGNSLMTFFNKTDYSFLLGPDIFVTPFLQSGDNIDVTFPFGDNWVYLFDKSQIFSGGQTVSLTIPLSEFPVFLKEGSVIELRLHAGQL